MMIARRCLSWWWRSIEPGDPDRLGARLEGVILTTVGLIVMFAAIFWWLSIWA